MESSTKETTLLTKPCTTLFSSVNNVVKAILKCLGFKLDTPKAKDPSSSSESDQQSDHGEANSEEFNAFHTTALAGTSGEAGNALMVSARRPPIDKGDGPSIY